jgi:hypothetical protein
MSHRQRKADTCQEDGRRYSDSTSAPESNATGKARTPSSVGDQETQRPRIERTEAGKQFICALADGGPLEQPLHFARADFDEHGDAAKLLLQEMIP